MENSKPLNSEENLTENFSYPPRSESEEQVIPLIKEELNISKKLESEKLFFHKEVVTEDVRIPVELLREDITVEHIPKNIEVEEIPRIQISDDLTIIPVFEEVAVVVKKLILVEEIHIRKNKSSEVQVIQDSVRKEIFRSDNNQIT